MDKCQEQGRNFCRIALAPRAPSAPANPKGRQHPIVASNFTIAAQDAEMPEALLHFLLSPADARTSLFSEFIFPRAYLQA